MRPVRLSWLPGVLGGAAAGPTISRVVNNEIELRPVLCRLADVADVAVADQMGEFAFDRRREKSLVDADVDHAGMVFAPFHQPFIERIHDLFVVEAIGMLGQMLVGVVADGVALPRIGLELFHFLVDLVEPARPARGHDGVREHALRSCFLVDLGARVELHFIGQKPVVRVLGRRAADARDFGVAVEKHFFKIVGELQIFDGLRLALQRRIPTGFAHGFALAHEVGDARIVAQKMSMHVHDELIGQRLGALAGHLRNRRLGPARVIKAAVGFVHRDECRRHACGGLEEGAPRHALPARQLAAEFLDARLELALLFASVARA